VQTFKLNHDALTSSLNANFWGSGSKHCCPSHAYAWLRGIYSTLKIFGLHEQHVDRIVLEHLPAGYYVERMLPGRVHFGMRFEDPYSRLGECYTKREFPYDTASDRMITPIYENPNHTEEFFARFFDRWLPEHKRVVEQRHQSRSPFSKFIGDNPTCFTWGN
jgi:hypothetical protein